MRALNTACTVAVSTRTFIDNSAGVDSSDREVNIKILLSDVVKKKRMSRAKRNELLASMTDDVASLVLRNNYLQTQSISMSEIRSVERIDEIAQLIKNLENTGLLDRAIEYLPEETEIDERRTRANRASHDLNWRLS